MRTHLLRVSVVAATAATVLVGSGGAGAVARPTGADDQPGSAHVWVTTPDRSMLLADRGAVRFTRADGTAPQPIAVDARQRFQSMDGFGASITDSSAVVLSRLDGHTRDRVMADLFDPRHGDGLSYLRQPMGASDFVATEQYTYDDVPAGQSDFAMRHFTVAHDRAQILPLLRQARRLNPRLSVLATPWSPPAWMKTNQSLIGGRLIDDPRVYRAYALYFVKFVQAYARAGVPVDAVTVQNEPQNRTPSGYPGMDLPVAQEKKLIEALGPAFARAGLRTKIYAYDHNWSEHPGDIASTPPDEQPPETEYPAEVLADPAAARWVDGVAYHCYSGDPSRQSDLKRQFPDANIYFTECSGSHGPDDTPAQIFADTLRFHARNVLIGSTRNWAKTVVNWNLALDPTGGPHIGGCGTCTGVVTVGPGQQVTRMAEYYVLGHAARFVRPGAVRIASTSYGATTGGNGEPMTVAFRNRDGSTVLIVLNDNDAARTITVRVGDRSFRYRLPGGALATFTWH